MAKDIKIFICEGERDLGYFGNVQNIFFKDADFRIISLSAKLNIYMLYQILKKDENLDLIELLREDPDNAKKLDGVTRQQVSETYMFFDLDIQQANLKKLTNPIQVIRELLDFFNNETENGKMYLSYPMVEALRDYKEGYCDSITGCIVDRKNIKDYKTLTGANPKTAETKKYDKNKWKNILNIFQMRIKCLFELDDFIETYYRKHITPSTIFDQEYSSYLPETVFVLSAFPEFILDYFSTNFWKSVIKDTKLTFNNCPKR
ncbi:MAG: hypothetical protein J5656_04675 [Clostridia bacterium]|nr:hypothetical protein [Clostridia bacterium]